MVSAFLLYIMNYHRLDLRSFRRFWHVQKCDGQVCMYSLYGTILNPIMFFYMKPILTSMFVCIMHSFNCKLFCIFSRYNSGNVKLHQESEIYRIIFFIFVWILHRFKFSVFLARIEFLLVFIESILADLSTWLSLRIIPYCGPNKLCLFFAHIFYILSHEFVKKFCNWNMKICRLDVMWKKTGA
jgi:hypothetical protein